MNSDPLETLVDELQRAFRNASGAQPSNQTHIREKWRGIGRYILSGPLKNADMHRLAVELHSVFIGDGHRTEIEHRAKDDPVLVGWHGVANYVLQQNALAPSP